MKINSRNKPSKNGGPWPFPTGANPIPAGPPPADIVSEDEEVLRRTTRGVVADQIWIENEYDDAYYHDAYGQEWIQEYDTTDGSDEL